MLVDGSGPASADPEKRLKLYNINVLAVEDNKVNQFVVERFLSKAGQRVKIAANGKEAIEIAAKEKFDIILMDINMPIMTGYEATEAIRKNKSWASNTSPILALTGSVFKTPEEFRAMGFTDFLLKPYDKEILFEKILELIESDTERR
jgi:CheY-like chemotaxis protein